MKMMTWITEDNYDRRLIDETNQRFFLGKKMISFKQIYGSLKKLFKQENRSIETSRKNEKKNGWIGPEDHVYR